MKAEDRELCESAVEDAIAEGGDLDRLIGIHERMMRPSMPKRAREMREYSIKLLRDAK